MLGKGHIHNFYFIFLDVIQLFCIFVVILNFDLEIVSWIFELVFSIFLKICGARKMRYPFYIKQLYKYWMIHKNYLD